MFTQHTGFAFRFEHRKWNRGRNGLHQLGQPVTPSILFPMFKSEGGPDTIFLAKSASQFPISFQRNSRERYLKMGELDVTGESGGDDDFDADAEEATTESSRASVLFEYNIKGLQPQTK